MKRILKHFFIKISLKSYSSL